MSAVGNEQTLREGLLALEWLEHHNDERVAVDPFGPSAAGKCMPCARWAGQMIRGRHSLEDQQERCSEAAEMQRRFDAAMELARAGR